MILYLTGAVALATMLITLTACEALGSRGPGLVALV
jgi:hypothetical protein